MARVGRAPEHAGDHTMNAFDPIEALADAKHEFGEHGGVNMSTETSSTFTVMDADRMPDLFQGRVGPERGYYLYGRHFNPTVWALGRQMAAMEHTEHAYCTASGMSAISSAIMEVCDAGDHVVAASTIYGGTHALLTDFLPRKAGIKVSRAPIDDLEAVERAFTDLTRVLYLETVANPTLVLADLPRLAELAHARGAAVIVDNTFTPLIFTPAELGADIVVYSLTKFVNGASDLVGGAVCGSMEFIQSLMDVHAGALMLLGPTMDPRIASEVSLRIPHLGLRMAEHSRRAQVFAERLAEMGLDVVYPGLPGYPQHELFKRLANPGYGFGGLLAIDVGTTERAGELMERLQNEARFGYMAVSLGYFDTLMSCSAASTSSEMSEAAQRAAGIRPGLVRMSIGYTGSLEQRWDQLEGIIRTMGLVPQPA